MDRVEGTAEVNATDEDSAEAPHLKRKEHDQPQQQAYGRNALESAAPTMTIDAEWRQHLASLRSPELSAEALAGKNLNHNPGSYSGPDPRSSSDPGVVVEELVLKNCQSLNQSLVGCSSGGGESSIRKGLWPNFRRLAVGLREAVPKESLAVDDRKDVNNSFQPEMWDQGHQPGTQLEPNYSKVSGYLAESENRVVTSSALTRIPNGIRTKVLPASGFPQFVIKNTLKGKGLAYRHQESEDASGIATQSLNNERYSSKTDMAADPSHRPSTKADEGHLFGGGYGGGASDLHHDGISLMAWLRFKHHKLSKIERLHIFKNILEFVDISHSKGLVLQHLRPSYFVISSSNNVKYIGSLVPLGQVEHSLSSLNQNINYLDHHLKKKRYLDGQNDNHDITAIKHHKAGEHYHDSTRHHMLPVRSGSKDAVEETDVSSFKVENSGYGFRDQLKQGDQYKLQNISGSPIVSDSWSKPSLPEILKLEEKWYSSPEELNGNGCSLSSNIYSLGVLLFELFCSLESWEVHSATMLDLHRRILPPTFLADNPKEAGFCLWLLYPDPSLRPKSRDILLCNLISECRDLSALDHPSTLSDEDAEAELLLHFLLSLKEQKKKQAAKLVVDLGCLKADIEAVERRHPSRTEIVSNARDFQSGFNDTSGLCPYKGPMHVDPLPTLSVPSINEERLMRNIHQLEVAYFSMRSKVDQSETSVAARLDKDVLRIRNRQSQVQSEPDAVCENKESTDCLGDFFEGLCKFARYSKFEVRGTLRNVDILNSANVICSLSFDRDEDYFAAAGVSRKIKIFEFSALLNDAVDIYYPVNEMSSRSRLSCVCWNSYIKNYLASTNYEGVVQLWDASTGQGFTQYIEHQKRAWSVDFSQVDPTKLASGSDDCSVKLWSINERNCIDTIRNMANVCCVQFSSHSPHLLAFGSADFKVYCYDLRNTRIPWCTLAGHRKTVSYVKFVDHETLVSASTDNTLKLWDLNKTNMSGLSAGACSLTFSGHTNEKNFVGLSVFDGYIACGSETNEVFAYYKTLPMSITSHKFGSIDPIMGQETVDDNGQFVSSVCWRGKSSMVVAANSTGSIKVLQLV